MGKGSLAQWYTTIVCATWEALAEDCLSPGVEDNLSNIEKPYLKKVKDKTPGKS